MEWSSILLCCGVGLSVAYALRWFTRGTGWCTSKVRLDGKTVIITGANTGIGKETARDMARRGARVILACRDLTKAKLAADDIISSTSNNKVFIRKLDLSSLASVRAFVEETLVSEDRLDILINNAGIMMCPQWETEDGFEMQTGTNHFGHFLLTNLLLDLLKKSASSRIVNVSSGGYMLAVKKGGIRFDDINLRQGKYNTMFAYGQSKLANIMFTSELARRLEGTDVIVNSLHPGAVNTELARNIPRMIPLSSIIFPVLFYISTFFTKTSVQGAQTSIHCAVDESVANVSGVYFSDCAPKALNKKALDAEADRRLWDLSVEAVGLGKSD